jgi:hypothetical protein
MTGFLYECVSEVGFVCVCGPRQQFSRAYRNGGADKSLGLAIRVRLLTRLRRVLDRRIRDRDRTLQIWLA